MSCGCNKVRFTSKRLAKACIRGFQRRKGRLNAYRCPDSPFWHIGHPPAALVAGIIQRHTIRPKHPQNGAL